MENKEWKTMWQFLIASGKQKDGKQKWKTIHTIYLLVK
ncbi:MAG: Uncharacterised protein [Arcobacter lacus]|nr:MAG: Uncharacterised protein [Arcobacter lacus]